MTERAGQRAAHIAPPGARKAECGRTITPYSRVHRDWPQCKSCLRAMKKYPSWTITTVYDQDGWSLPPIGRSETTASSSNLTVRLPIVRFPDAA